MGLGQRRRWGWQLAALQCQPGGLYRYARLTGHTYLAQPTTIPLELVGLFGILSGASQVLPALLLVMAGLCDSPDRATINTFATGSIIEKKAIGPMVRIQPGSRLNGYLGHYRSNPHGFAFCGDQSVAQTESAQTGRMGGMALGPARGIGKPFRIDDGPV